jgi:hypothetical protein
MRTLIVGASGFIGSALQSAFGSDAVGTYCAHPVEGLRQLDMRDGAAVQRLVAEVRPGLIVQPAAQPNVDWCEDHEQESYDANVSGTRNVAEAARAALPDGRHQLRTIHAPTGAVEVFLECVRPLVHLLIFGAGEAAKVANVVKPRLVKDRFPVILVERDQFIHRFPARQPERDDAAGGRGRRRQPRLRGGFMGHQSQPGKRA